jgi:hypothetical protein
MICFLQELNFQMIQRVKTEGLNYKMIKTSVTKE